MESKIDYDQCARNLLTDMYLMADITMKTNALVEETVVMPPNDEKLTALEQELGSPLDKKQLNRAILDTGEQAFHEIKDHILDLSRRLRSKT